ITLTGRLGYLSCAVAVPTPKARAASSIAIKTFMRSSQCIERRKFFPFPLQASSAGFDTVAAVRGVLNREKYDVAIRRRLTAMHRIGRPTRPQSPGFGKTRHADKVTSVVARGQC